MKATLATLSLVAALGAAPAFAQGMAGEMNGMGDLPAICTANPPASPAHMMGGEAGDMDEAHRMMASSMDGMHEAMALGMRAADLDVAFVCGMIPHHRGAIAMAKAELAHGDDPFARRLAEAIIAAQEQEITEMLAWLETQN
jgi:hypothetical protein